MTLDPIGNTFEENQLRMNVCGVQGTTAGNVFEISRAISGTGYTMRGGCYYMTARSSSVMNGEPLPATFRHLHVGLRMCADAP